MLVNTEVEQNHVNTWEMGNMSLPCAVFGHF